MEYGHVIHPIKPVFNELSRILILGSFPSVKSREQNFFYGHKQNRFWKVTAAVFSDDIPVTIHEKTDFLLRHHIAVWDVIYSCDIAGSSDTSIKNVVPTDLCPIIEASHISKIFCNGKTAGKYYTKYQEPVTNIPAVTLPSTSPANAAYTLDMLKNAWKEIIA